MSGTIPAEAKAVHKSKHYQLVATANLVLHSQGLLPRAAFCIVRTSWQVHACKGKHRAPNNMSEACRHPAHARKLKHTLLVAASTAMQTFVGISV